jgi:hypothetical protein
MRMTPTDYVAVAVLALLAVAFVFSLRQRDRHRAYCEARGQVMFTGPDYADWCVSGAYRIPDDSLVSH